MSYGLVAGLSNAVLTHSGSISLFGVIVADICSFCRFPVFVGFNEQIEELVQFVLAILATHRKLAKNTTAFLSQKAISNAVHSSASFIPVSSQLPLIDTTLKKPEVILNRRRQDFIKHGIILFFLDMTQLKTTQTKSISVNFSDISISTIAKRDLAQSKKSLIYGIILDVLLNSDL